MKKNLITPIICVLVLFACKTETTNEELIISPNEIEKPSYTDFQIEDLPGELFDFINENGAELKLENGGRIRVAPHTLVNQNGEVVKGKVTLNFKEYHSLVDIVFSGLPMRYDSAGIVYDFQSAGMFSIVAEQNGAPLQIKKDETIEVDLANYQDTKCYNFYALNEETENWEYIKTEKAQPKPVENELILDVQRGLDYQKVESLKGKTVIAWKVLNDINPEVLLELKAQDIEEVDGEYHLFCSGRSPRTLKVEPVFLTDMEMEDGQNTNLLYAYKAKTKTVRKAAIERFGSYNWDMVMKVPENFASVSTIAFPRLAPTDYRVKLLVYNVNGIFERVPAEQTRLPLFLESKMILMAISKFGDVAVIGSDEIEAFRKREIKSLPAFTSLEGKFNNNEELSEILKEYI